MNTYTPGKWSYRFGKNLSAVTTPKGEMRISCNGFGTDLQPIQCDNIQEWDANVKLMAMAPELKEKLDELYLVASTTAHNNPKLAAVLKDIENWNKSVTGE